MTADDLDTLYAAMCREMKQLSVDQVAEYLARIVLLLMTRIDDPEAVRSAIDQGRLDLDSTTAA